MRRWTGAEVIKWLADRLSGKKWGDSDFWDLQPRYDDGDPIEKYIETKQFIEVLTGQIEKDLQHLLSQEMTPEEIAEKARQGFHAFKLWFESIRLEIIETEVPLVSERYRFGGTFDAIGKTPLGGYELIDFKTSNKLHAESMLPQLAAYAALIHENKTVPKPLERFHLLRLGKDYADFHHHSWPREALMESWEKFRRLRDCYELDKQIKKVAGT